MKTTRTPTRSALSTVTFALLTLGAVPGHLQAQSINVTSTGVGIGTPTPTGALDVRSGGGSVIANGLYFWSSGLASSDQLPEARLVENWGIRFGAPDDRWVLSTGNSLVVGYQPAGLHWGTGNLVVSGNTGVGTFTPRYKVEIQTDAVSGLGPTLALTNGSGGVGAGAALAFTSMQAQPISAQIQSIDDGNYSMHLVFQTKAPGAATNTIVERMRVTSSGNVGIGTSTPSYPLQVVGSAYATSFITPAHTYADYVFSKDYKLPTLAEVEQHISKEGHLPGIPSEKEAIANGIDVGDMQVRLLAQVEQLTLHAIEQQKQIKLLMAEVSDLKEAKNERINVSSDLNTP